MAKRFNLNKTSLQKLEKFKNHKPITDEIYKTFFEVVVSDVKSIKDCSEKSIVDFYIEEFSTILDKDQDNDYDEEFWSLLKKKVRTKLVKKYVGNKTFDNTIDIYFNEVKKQYILHPQDESEDIEFCEKNRDIFIKNNLKLAINVAKRYRNLGLDFEDLIQIANVGLLKAYEKFDSERSNLRISIIKDIKSLPDHQFSVEEITDIISRNFKYTKLLDSTLKKIPSDGFTSKDDFLAWTNKNIKGASFSSISFFWIRAIVLMELNNYAKIIKVPKVTSKGKEDEDFDEEDFKNDNYSDNYINDEEYSPSKINIIRLDSINPYTEDNYSDSQISKIANEEFIIENDSIEEVERQNTFKELISKILYKLPPLDRRVIIKKYGIGLPFPMSINEISENENISFNKIKYILTNSLKVIQRNISEEDKKTLLELLR